MSTDQMYGLAGRFVRRIAPHTEADPAVLYASLLCALGNVIGPGPHVRVGATRHPSKLFLLVVGETAKARKGTSWSEVLRVCEGVDEAWARENVISGLGSGEALIGRVADPEDVDPTGRTGLSDPRVMLVDEEYARTLAVCRREGATLSPVIRGAWDDAPLHHMTKGASLSARSHHISIVAHVTLDELRAKGLGLDVANGMLNRFMIVRSRRSKLLPSGGSLDVEGLQDLMDEAKGAVEAARRLGVVRRTPEGEERWAEAYLKLAEDDPGGLIGACTARAEPMVIRIALVLCLLDRSEEIDAHHIEAALDLWACCRASAQWVIGDEIGHRAADRIATLLRDFPLGLDRTAISRHLSGHVKKLELDVAVGLLLERRRVVERTEETRGRPRTVYVLATPSSATGDGLPPEVAAT